MKKSILLLIAILSALFMSAQIQNTAIKQIENDTTPFGVNLPAGTLLLDLKTNSLYSLDSAATSGDKLTTAYTNELNAPMNTDTLTFKVLTVSKSLSVKDTLDVSGGVLFTPGSSGYTGPGTGTISIAYSSDITGVGTDFLNELAVGSAISANGATLVIQTVSSATSATTFFYTGTPISNSAYTVSAPLNPANNVTFENIPVVASGNTGTVSISGSGNRMMWIPSKGSFYAGHASNDEWDLPNIGIYSVAFGDQNKQTAALSLITGFNNENGGRTSIVGGENNINTGYSSLVLGASNTNSSYYSIVSGTNNTTASAGQVLGGNRNVSLSNSTILSGTYDSIQSGAIYCSILGGENNTIKANASRSTILGGVNNLIKSNTIYSSIVGGHDNTINDDLYSSVILGGSGLTATRSNTAYATNVDVADTLRANQVIVTNGAVQLTGDLTTSGNINISPKSGPVGTAGTGTISVSYSKNVTGTGTLFLTEAGLGDKLVFNGRIYTISDIIDDLTVTTSEFIATSYSGEYYIATDQEASTRMDISDVGLFIHGSTNSYVPNFMYTNHFSYVPAKAAFRGGSLTNSMKYDSLGYASIAYGSNPTASGQYAVAFGSGAIARGDNSFVWGLNTRAYKAAPGSFAGGSSCQAQKPYSFVFGYYSYAKGSRSVAMGEAAIAEADHAVAIGEQNRAQEHSVSVGGRHNLAMGTYSSCFGGNSNSSNADYSSTLGGYNNYIYALANTASIIGGHNISIAATGANSVVLGCENLVVSDSNTTFTQNLKVTKNLKVTGAHFDAIKTITANYTTTASDYSIIAGSATPMTVTLQSESQNTGQTLRFYNYGAGSLNVAGSYYGASCMVATLAQGGSMIIQFDGTRWAVFSSNSMTYTNCP